MTDDLSPQQQITDTEAQQGAEQSPQSQQPAKPQRPRLGWLSWLAFLLCIGGWIALHFSGILSASLCAGAIIASIAALRQRSRAAHNLALTSLVAAAVLALVLAIVAVALYMLTKS